MGGRANSAMNNAADQYMTPQGGFSWSPGETGRSMVMPTAGVIKKMYVTMDGVPSVGSSNRFTLRKNTVSQALTVLISGGFDTTGFDDVNEVAVVAGDLISILQHPTAFPTARSAMISLIFKGSTAGESIICYCSTVGVGGGGGLTKYQAVMGNVESPAAWGNSSIQPIPTNGTLKKMYVNVQTAPGVGESLTITLLKGGIATALTVTIAGVNTTGNDVANTVAVSAMDELTFQMTSSGGAANQGESQISMVFAPTIDGEAPVMGTSTNVLGAAGTTFNNPCGVGSNEVWGAAEAQFYQIVREATISKLCVTLDIAPGAGNSRTFEVRQNGADTGVQVVLSNAEVGGVDNVNSVAVIDGDLIAIEHIPAGPPDAGDAHWGFVISTGGAAAAIPSGSMASRLIGAKII